VHALTTTNENVITEVNKIMILVIVCNSQIVPSIIIFSAPVHMFLIRFCGRSEEKWTLYFTCKGVPAGQEFIQYETDRSDLTFGNLLIMKSHMGYGVRDYLYYKNKKAVATLKEIDYDVDANSMVVINADEGEIRLVGIK
jgi:hypothetical protein